MQIFMGTTMYGKRFGLHINRRRMKCHDCNSTFFEPLPGMHEKHRVTKRLMEHIEKRVLRDAFTRIANDVGLDESTIRAIFSEYADCRQRSYHPTTPCFLGIDEAHLYHHYRCVLADVEKRTIIDLLENQRAAYVANYLSNMPKRSHIETVCMDMWQPYRDAVKAVLPEARIVIDKFHIVRYASDTLESARKELRKTLTDKQRKGLMHDRFALLKRPDKLTVHEYLVLSHWLGYPIMKLAYELKENFYDLFDNSASRQAAEQEYGAWLKRIIPDVRPYFEPLMRAVENWHEEIIRLL
jgi:transposase